MNELKIVVNQGVINFPEYEKLKQESLEVAEKITSMEVTEDNIKESKKILATVNKSVKALEDKRKEIKKEILKPYTEFEAQVKEIVNIVKQADEVARNQVRDLEEQQREIKREEIKELWNKRLLQYDLSKIMTFEDFITNKHLNKTTTMKSIEEEMVEFLEKIERDIKTLSKMEYSNELIKEYKDTKDFGLAVSIVTERHKQVEEIKEVIEEVSEEVKKKYVFIISNDKDAKLAEMLLKENNIEYIKEVR